MKFTFGIITGPDPRYRQNPFDMVNLAIDSIEREKISDYEIIVVGGEKINRKNTTHIPFDESLRSKWITRKKNMITEKAKYDNIVYMHDYIILENGWYKGFLDFGNDFDICMNVIKNIDGSRFRDWTLWAELDNMLHYGLIKEDVDYIEKGRYFLIPYEIDYLTRFMYISGAYWIAKKNVMKEFPLDESLSWGQSEDVKWSKQVRNKFKFKMNKFSSVRFIKQKSISNFYNMDEKTISIIEKLKNEL